MQTTFIHCCVGPLNCMLLCLVNLEGAKTRGAGPMLEYCVDSPTKCYPLYILVFSQWVLSGKTSAIYAGFHPLIMSALRKNPLCMLVFSRWMLSRKDVAHCMIGTRSPSALVIFCLYANRTLFFVLHLIFQPVLSIILKLHVLIVNCDYKLAKVGRDCFLETQFSRVRLVSDDCAYQYRVVRGGSTNNFKRCAKPKRSLILRTTVRDTNVWW